MTKEQRRIACAEETLPNFELYEKINGQDFYYWSGIDCPKPLEELPDPESYLNDCKPLIKMANKAGYVVHVEICPTKTIVQFSRFVRAMPVVIKPTIESAIVEAFLKWRGKI